MIDLVDLIHVDGAENPSGVGSMHGIALFSYMTTVQKADDIIDGGATPTNVGSIATPHVFATGKCMKKVYCTENKGDAKEEPVGDTDSKNAKCINTLMIPGVNADYHAMMHVLNNSTGLLFTQLSDGVVLQYGSERFPCHFTMTWSSGNNESYRGYTITATNYGPSVIYTPGLNFTPAV